MLDWAHSDQRLDSELLCDLGSTNEEVILVGAHASVVVGEVDDFVCSLHRHFERGTVRCESLVDLEALAGQRTLEAVNVLVVWLEVKQTHFGVSTAPCKALDDSL